MRQARNEYKAARLFLTEERSGAVIVRFAVKPLRSEWSVMHHIARVRFDDYETPLPGMPEVLDALARGADRMPLP